MDEAFKWDGLHWKVDRLSGVFMFLFSACSYRNSCKHDSVQLKRTYLWFFHTTKPYSHFFPRKLNSSAWPVSFNSICWNLFNFDWTSSCYSVGQVVLFIKSKYTWQTNWNWIWIIYICPSHFFSHRNRDKLNKSWIEFAVPSSVGIA